ncbi:MAG: type IV secretion system DNA-binding domain-containing protein [Lachnospiraceae bacterium]|jgi:hypothetical protein|nr:type IV secretion system DNA-binding domain-containing protein [Lachnospiraceae bacterium]
MNHYTEIIFQLLIIMTLLSLLICWKPFNNRWLNICIHISFGFLISGLIPEFLDLILPLQKSVVLYIPYLLFCLLTMLITGNKKTVNSPKKGEDVFILETNDGKNIEFYYPRDNFLVYGGAGSGKTASIGKPLMEQFIKNKWAGFIYDYKDFDYTRTAYNLAVKYNYPFKFYYISFTDMSRTYRFNPLDKKVVEDEALLQQVMDDFLKSMMPIDGKTDEWYQGALGILKGVAYRFYSFKGEFERLCTLPHILNFILLAKPEELIKFLEGDNMSKSLAGAFIGAKGSERTLSSYLSTLNNYITNLATNKNICYVLTGDDFIFNLVDPEDPKLFAVCNNFARENIISPIIAMLLPISARKIEFGNKIKFAYILDEMTTFKVNNFQQMPSVLREYNAAFVVMTQSGSKLEKVYKREDRASIEANCANIFLGRTKDVEALKYYPLFFGKHEAEKWSYSTGKSGQSQSRNSTKSTQKEEVYDANTFAELEQGEFIMGFGTANYKKMKAKLQMFKLQEDPLPVINAVTKQDIDDNYNKIIQDLDILYDGECGR